MYPAVPLLMRKIKEDVNFGKMTLPAGSEIFIVPYATHRTDYIYSKPDEFIPERFLPENCDQRSPYAFLPFSAGPRNCVS
jgi:cytochrome P450 family 4